MSSPAGTKLFLGGLSNDTTRESIDAHFSRYGNIIDSVVMVENGRPRGFGFVTFDSADSAAAALNETQELDGRVVECKEAQPRPGSGGGGRPAPGSGDPNATMKSDKVFVGGLPQNCEDSKIIEYFSRYGNIVDAVVMKDRNTGHSRGFGFVKFDNTDSADRVIEDYAEHKIDGKWCECKKAVPQDQMSAPPRKGGGKGGGYGGSGGGYGKGGGGGGYGAGAGGYGGGAPASSYAAYASAYGAYGGYGGGAGAYGAYGGMPAYAAYAAYGATPQGAYGSYAKGGGKGAYGSAPY